MAVDTTQDLTELNAVNSVLAAIGQSPVTTLDFENPETSFVYNLIQECSRDVQDEGWVFNREEYYPLKPNSDKNILIPAMYCAWTLVRTMSIVTLMLLRETVSYMINYTTPLNSEVLSTLILYGCFHSTDLPSVFQRYITSRASVRAAIQMIDNAQLSQLLTVQENTNRAACIEYEANQGDYNYMDFQPGTAYRTYRPYTALRRYS